MKKLFSLVLAVVLALSLAVPAIAADVEGPVNPDEARIVKVHCTVPGCPGFMYLSGTGFWICDTCGNRVPA